MEKKQIPKGKVVRVPIETYELLKKFKSIDPRASITDAAFKLVNAGAKQFNMEILQ
jgi:hypothetical protein